MPQYRINYPRATHIFMINTVLYAEQLLAERADCLGTISDFGITATPRPQMMHFIIAIVGVSGPRIGAIGASELAGAL